MRQWQSQSHVRWYCRYHIVFVPKYRRRSIYGSLRRNIGGVMRDLCRQHGVELVEGHAMGDHIHLCLSIPPKYSVANTVGFLKGKSAIQALTDEVLDETLASGEFDKLTGSSGSDWFIVSGDDKITDFKKQNKDGDLVTVV